MPSLSPPYPAFSVLFCPLSPQPPSPAGKGEPQSLFRRGLRPRHPGIRPPAALTDRAEQVPGGLNPSGTGAGAAYRALAGGLPRRCRLTLPSLSPTGGCGGWGCRSALPLVFLPAPYPPDPRSQSALPRWGRGSPKVYFAGGFAPGTPALNRLRHLQFLPCGHPAQGACGAPQNRKNRLSMGSAGSQGEGGPGERNFGV